MFACTSVLTPELAKVKRSQLDRPSGVFCGKYDTRRRAELAGGCRNASTCLDAVTPLTGVSASMQIGCTTTAIALIVTPTGPSVAKA
jgi:hypothetical protein